MFGIFFPPHSFIHFQNYIGSFGFWFLLPVFFFFFTHDQIHMHLLVSLSLLHESLHIIDSLLNLGLFTKYIYSGNWSILVLRVLPDSFANEEWKEIKKTWYLDSMCLIGPEIRHEWNNWWNVAMVSILINRIVSGLIPWLC